MHVLHRVSMVGGFGREAERGLVDSHFTKSYE